ncbi:MAG: DUF5906 domain-containing protein, partial [Nanoarchaeota archaeon]
KFYDRFQFDQWGIHLWFYGLPSTGKSAILQFIGDMYDSMDVGILPDNCQADFGLEGMHKSFVILAQELTEKFNLPQALLQQIATDYYLSINRKFDKRENVNFRASFGIASNIVLKYQDNNGSMIRRMLVVHFKNPWPVSKTLNQEAFREITQLIRGRMYLRTCLAYRIMCNYVGKRPIWNMVPTYFVNTRNEIANRSHALRKFFAESKEIGVDVTRSGKFYITESSFYELFEKYCKDKKIPMTMNWSDEYYQAVFSEKGIIKVTENRIVGSVSVYEVYLDNCYKRSSVCVSDNELELFLNSKKYYHLVPRQPGESTNDWKDRASVDDKVVYNDFINFVLPLQKDVQVWNETFYHRVVSKIGIVVENVYVME